jgi:hypothetical protein
MFGVGVGVRVGGFTSVGGGGIDAQAQAHYNRVIADGGVVPAGLSGVNAFFTAVKTIYGTSDITTAVSVGLDAQYLGYKLGAGAGATSGQAAQKLYSCAGSSGDVEQTTAASQPLLLAHSGASSDNYYYGSGVSGNFCSTPNAPANQITGDIELTAYNIRYVSNGNQSLISKNRYSFYITSGNILAFEDSSAVTTYSTANIGATFTGSVRVFRTATEIKFYTSTDNTNFIQLGSTITVSTTLSGGGSTLYVGEYAPALGFLLFRGRIQRATIATSLGGTPVVDFNPATYNASTSQTQWTSTTGEVWTINTGTDATGYKGVLVDRSLTMFDGIEDFLQNPTILRGDICSQYLVYKTENASASGLAIIDSALSAWQNALTPEASLMKLYMNGSSGTVSKSLDTLLTMYTTTNNQGVSNSIQKNNDTPTTNAYSPALSGTGLSIGKLANLAFYQKGNVQTYISAIGVNTTTIRTDMYNYIRSINNNAF